MREAVSIIIPTYNRAKMLARAVESVLLQLCPQDEIIIIDDGSTDDTATAVAALQDRVRRSGSTLRYIRQENAGAGAARNRGIAESRNDLIAFLDSDDEWLPGKLDRQCALMSACRETVMCFGDFKLRFADGRMAGGGIDRWQQDGRSWEERLGAPSLLSDLAERPDDEEKIRVYRGDLYGYLMGHCCVSAFTAMVRRSLAGAGLHFTEGVGMFEDWACFGRVASRGPVAFLECDLAVQNGHAEGRLTDADGFARATARVAVLEEVWGADAEFLRAHGEEYRRTIDPQRIIKAAGLINEGRTAEARVELGKVHDAPMRHRFLSFLPGPLAKAVLGARRAVRQSLS